MKTNSMYYNNFNLLRLFAALQISYQHMIEHLDITNSIAIYIRDIIAVFPGVPIFFLISGYLITMSYDKNQNIYTYMTNRFLRIMPGLYMSFFIGILILWYFGQLSDIKIEDILPWIIAQLTVFQFYNPEFIRDFGVGVINGSLWTISIELFFYILLPFIFIFLQKDFYKRFFFLFIISLAFYYYIMNISSNQLIYEKLIFCSILPYLFYFLLGFYFYKYFYYLKKYIEGKVIFYFIAYLITCYLNVDNFIYIIFTQLVFALFIFSFIFSYRTLSFRLMKHYDFTYGIYIYHMLIVNIFIEMKYMKDVENLVYVLILTIICGILSYFFIEKPFLDMKKNSLYTQLYKKER